MKTWPRIFSSVLLTVSTSAALAANRGTPVDVNTRFLFVPSGFDDNDQVEVVLDGYLPNACYKAASPRVSFDASTYTFTVTAVANYFAADDTVCGTYQVPFTMTASLGQIPQGLYKIKAFGGPEKSLAVKQAAGVGPDDYLYMPVDHVHVSVDMRHKHITAAVEGRFTNSCMRFSDIKILDEGENVVVLPIMTFDQQEHCHATDMRYKPIEAKIPWRQPGRYLLHVRGLSGVAVNQVFEVDSLGH